MFDLYTCRSSTANTAHGHRAAATAKLTLTCKAAAVPAQVVEFPTTSTVGELLQHCQRVLGAPATAGSYLRAGGHGCGKPLRDHLSIDECGLRHLHSLVLVTPECAGRLIGGMGEKKLNRAGQRLDSSALQSLVSMAADGAGS